MNDPATNEAATPTTSRSEAFAGVARGPFLALPVALVICGGGAAAFAGVFSWDATILALLGLVALHAAVNTFNEVSDYRTGIDLETRRTPFSGGSGTLLAGKISPGAALAFGIVNASVGLAVGVLFLLRVGWVLLPIVVTGAFCVLAYTQLLARIGLGEIAAGLGLGTLPVLGTVLVQEGTIGPAAVAASVPAFFMTFNLLLLNEFPDEHADRKGGRRNLVSILGRRPAAIVYAIAALMTPASVIASVVIGVLPALALIAVIPSLVLLGPLRWAFGDPGTEVPIPALGANVIWNLATNAVLGAALAIAAG
ncbi:MAG: prenyltransferase [Acidobacteria bacterium]|jgi:1,4-dihydroxy-2-naphthoate octaprenyltransferase|nr:prenyltransferase [Acidobacteriota bacterium]